MNLKYRVKRMFSRSTTNPGDSSGGPSSKASSAGYTTTTTATSQTTRTATTVSSVGSKPAGNGDDPTRTSTTDGKQHRLPTRLFRSLTFRSHREAIISSSSTSSSQQQQTSSAKQPRPGSEPRRSNTVSGNNSKYKTAIIGPSLASLHPSRPASATATTRIFTLTPFRSTSFRKVRDSTKPSSLSKFPSNTTATTATSSPQLPPKSRSAASSLELHKKRLLLQRQSHQTGKGGGAAVALTAKKKTTTSDNKKSKKFLTMPSRGGGGGGGGSKKDKQTTKRRRGAFTAGPSDEDEGKEDGTTEEEDDRPLPPRNHPSLGPVTKENLKYQKMLSNFSWDDAKAVDAAGQTARSRRMRLKTVGRSSRSMGSSLGDAAGEDDWDEGSISPRELGFERGTIGGKGGSSVAPSAVAVCA